MECFLPVIVWSTPANSQTWKMPFQDTKYYTFFKVVYGLLEYPKYVDIMMASTSMLKLTEPHLFQLGKMSNSPNLYLFYTGKVLINWANFFCRGIGVEFSIMTQGQAENYKWGLWITQIKCNGNRPLEA